MNTTTKKKATSLRLGNELYKEVKERAKQENRSVNNFLELIISEAMEYNIPNEETKRALDQAIKDRALPDRKWYDNIDDMFKDLMKD